MGAWSSCIMRERACATAALVLTHHPRPLRASASNLTTDWFSGRQEFSGPTNPNNPADIAPFVGGIHPARHAPAGGRGLGPPGDGGGGLGPHGRVRLRPDAGIVHTLHARGRRIEPRAPLHLHAVVCG